MILATFQTIFLGHEGVTEYMISFLNKESIECQIIDNYTHNDESGNFEVNLVFMNLHMQQGEKSCKS